MLSLQTFNPHKSFPPYLDSPRSLEACARQGISPEELLIKPKSYFQSLLGPKAPKAIVQLHIESYERRRTDKLQLVTQERLNIIREKELSRGVRNSQESRNDGQNQFLIDHEQRKIATLKKKQEQEIMSLREKQRILEEIRCRNEEKQRIAQQKSAYYKKVVEENQKDAEIRRRKEEKRKKSIEEAKETEQKAQQKHRSEQKHRKFMEALELEKRRKREAKLRELEARKRQEKCKIQTEKILSEQREAVELRRREMAIRDAERKLAMEGKRKKMLIQNAKIQREKQEKLAKAQENLKLMIENQKSKYEEKQKMTEEKRQEFEHLREMQKEESRKKAEEKQKLIEKTLAQSHEIELQRKQEFLENMQNVENRKRELAKIAEFERKQKITEEKQKEKQRKQVRKRMELLESQRKSSIFQKLQEAEMQVADVKAKHSWDLRILQEKHMLKRKEREDEVQRVAKMKEYHRKQIQERIKTEDEKAEKVLEEKRKLLEARSELRREMDAQKERLLHDFSNSRQSSSRISTAKPSQLTQSLSSLSPKHPSTFRSPRDDRLPTSLSTRSDIICKPMAKDLLEKELIAIRRKKNAIMKEEIEFELRKEEERDRLLLLETDPTAKDRLEKVFGLERAKASERIEDLAETFEREIEKVRNRLKTAR